MTNPKHTDTSRSGDLVERLRGDKYTCRENMGCGTMEFCACATMEDAADRIEALTAENKRLREAGTKLAGFAAHDSECEDITGAYPGSCSCGYSSAWKAWSAALGDTQ